MDFFLKIVLFTTLIIFSLTIHEASHALISKICGDNTAQVYGRLTINPIKHLDYIGSIFFLLTILLTGYGIGWAKPVPVNIYKLKNINKNIIQISLAGPISNFLIAIFTSFIVKIIFFFTNIEYISISIILAILISFIKININLALFNLIPISPLDGYNVLIRILPNKIISKYKEVEKYSFHIFILLIILPLYMPNFPNFINYFIARPTNLIINFLLN